MTVPYRRDQTNYVYLTDRFGTPNDRVALGTADEVAVRDMAPALEGEETGFVARTTDGRYGILMEVVEICHDEMERKDDPANLGRMKGKKVNGFLCDGTRLPTVDDAVAELLSQAEWVREAYPDLEIEVAVDADCFDGCAVIRAFLPQGSPYLARMAAIADRFFEVYERMAEPGDAPRP